MDDDDGIDVMGIALPPRTQENRKEVWPNTYIILTVFSINFSFLHQISSFPRIHTLLPIIHRKKEKKKKS
jgi:hypothetical protein